MGGNAVTDLLLPVGEREMSSWQEHIERGTPSDEPGTDFYCPPGTPIIAPADGVIWGSGNSVMPATGRWVGIDFDNGMGWRTMHHQKNLITSGRVARGEVYAISGSSGYGSEFFGEPSRNSAFWNNTGGDHVHATLWPTHDHKYGYRSYKVPYTVDLMNHVDRSASAGGDTINKILEDAMSNPIINVVPTTGVHFSNGTLYVGLDDGSFEPLRPPFAANIRGIIGKAFYGGNGDGDKDTIPTLSQADFNALKVVWATMCKGRTDAAAVWAEGVHAQDAEGRGLYLDGKGAITTEKTSRPLKFTAAGFLASTNALANDTTV